MRTLRETHSQPIKVVGTITGETRKWAIQISACVKPRSIHTDNNSFK